MKSGCTLIITLLVLLLASTPAIAAKSLKLGANSPGTRPNLYYNEALGRYDGVVVDLLNYVSSRSDMQVEYIDSHRGRNEFLVSIGKLDMFFSSVSWLKNADAVISTDPIFQHFSYLYSLKPFPADFTLSKASSFKVCTRRGFKYPKLDAGFKSGSLIRIDASSHDTLLDMFLLGRCDMTELNDLNAKIYFKLEKFANKKIYRSEEPTSIVNASLIMHPSRKAERDAINRYMQEYKTSGQYQVVFEKHLSTFKLATKR